MEKLMDLIHLFLTVFLAYFALCVVVPTITDVTMDAVCPGQYECSLAIYLTSFQQAITGFGAVVVTPLIGNLSDKYGRKTLLTLPVTASIFPTVILACSRSTNFYYAYYVMKILTGMITESAITSLAYAYAADKISPDLRLSAFGIVSGIVLVSFVFGNLVARFLSIAATFQVATILSVFATVYMRIFLEESIPYGSELSESLVLQEERGHSNENVPELPRKIQTFKVVPSVKDVISLLHSSPTFSQAAAVTFFSNLAVNGLQASLMYFLKARFHFNKNQFGDLMIIVGVLGSISQMIVLPLLSPAIGEKRLLSIGLFSSFLHMFFYSISWSVWVPYAATSFTVLSYCVNPCVSSIVSKQVEPNEQGKAQGCIFSIQSFSNIISPLIFSHLTALFLSEDAPFYFPGFSIMFLGLTVLIGFVVSLMIKVNPYVAR